MDDLHDLLARREALQDVLAERALLDRSREVLRDLEVDVRLEQGEPDLAHRLRDGLLVETATAKPTESALEPVGERVEHGTSVCGARPPASEIRCRASGLAMRTDGHVVASEGGFGASALHVAGALECLSDRRGCLHRQPGVTSTRIIERGGLG